MTAEALTAGLALTGIVILVASLLSGILERSGLPQVAVFLVLGALLGPAGLRLVDFTLDSPALHAIAPLALLLVLFTDAITMDIGEVRRNARLAALVLGPGTLLPAVVIALAGWWLLHLSPGAAAVLGAALASTDPVLLRGLLRRPDLPAPARLALRLESGMNDVVLLPIVVLVLLLLRPERPPTGEVARHVVGLFLLGPAAGVATGLVAITLLDQIRRRAGVRRDYESLYALGVALTAYAAAELLGGSGFLAGFAAGLTVAWLDVELCDCFLDYGQATAEMLLLLAFVAFGTSLIWTGLTIIDVPTLLFATIAVVARAGILHVMLARHGIDRQNRRLIAWFGPRGLSSLLLVLLAVFAGAAEGERLFTVACLVVLLSIVVHGASLMLLVHRVDHPAAPVQAPASAARDGIATGAALPILTAAVPAAEEARALPERITLEELLALRRTDPSTVLLDVRTERSFAQDPVLAEGALRFPPDDAVRLARAMRLPWKSTLVAYCA